MIEGPVVAFDETSDGALVVQTNVRGNPDTDIGLLPMSGDRTVSPLLATRYDEQFAALSPDGRWLAYQSNESGRFEIYVRPFPDVDTRKWPVSTAGGQRPRWARNGSALYFVGPTHLMRAAVDAGPTFSWHVPESVIDHGPYRRPGAFIPVDYELSADGQRFLFVKPVVNVATGEGARSELIVVQGWLDELEQRASAE